MLTKIVAAVLRLSSTSHAAPDEVLPPQVVRQPCHHTARCADPYDGRDADLRAIQQRRDKAAHGPCRDDGHTDATADRQQQAFVMARPEEEKQTGYEAECRQHPRRCEVGRMILTNEMGIPIRSGNDTSFAPDVKVSFR